MKKQLILCIAIYLTLFIFSCKRQETQTPVQPNKISEQQQPIILISSPVVNVHKTASTQSEKVTQALYGEAVTILEESNEWAKITLPQQFDYTGWVQKTNLKKVIVPSLAQSKIIASANATVYKQPNLNSSVFTLLPLGTIVNASKQESNQEFTSVHLLDGSNGFVTANRVKDFKYEVNKADANSIISTAKQLVGVPYLWGGMTNHGVDCSGFTHTVFKVNGIKLHRDADQQYANDGVSVEINKIMPGDLVFFSTYKPGPSHEGIYVGDGKFIHSSSSQGVGYSSLNDSYYRKKLIGAKRILN
jgi:gamma-D-glutamyl-L-lysine dipeptidyl-peptidase